MMYLNRWKVIVSTMADYNLFRQKYIAYTSTFKETSLDTDNNIYLYKENGFVNDIYTEDVNFFTKQFKKKTLKELAC